MSRELKFFFSIDWGFGYGLFSLLVLFGLCLVVCWDG